VLEYFGGGYEGVGEGWRGGLEGWGAGGEFRRGGIGCRGSKG